MSTETANDYLADREGYIAGLHMLADLLAEHPEVPLPYTGSYRAGQPLNWILTTDDDQPALLAVIARALPGKVDKEPKDSGLYYLRGQLAGLHVMAVADRAEVCERVVTGTREVTEEVPDPEALAAVPTTTVTKVVEDVEWVCRPLLASERADADTAAEPDRAEAQTAGAR